MLSAKRNESGDRRSLRQCTGVGVMDAPDTQHTAKQALLWHKVQILPLPSLVMQPWASYLAILAQCPHLKSRNNKSLIHGIAVLKKQQQQKPIHGKQ